MEIRLNCELIEVTYENEGKKAVLTFLDEEQGEVLEVNFNKQNYDNDKKEWFDDFEKAAKVDEWCKEYFETDFAKLTQSIGLKKDIYHYDNFNSLWESDYPVKFPDNMVGEIFEAIIKNVEDTGKAIVIQYNDTETGTLYKSNMSYSKYLEARKEWFVDPNKKEKVFKKFQDRYGISIEKAESILGKTIMVEVKKAFGTHTYGDIKKPKWSK